MESLPSNEFITITHPKIISFYKTHPSISIEYICLLVIDLIEKTNQDTVSHSMLNQMLDQLKLMNTNINQVSTSITSSQSEHINHMNHKMTELKDKYVDEIKMIVSNNTLEKIPVLLKDQEKQITTSMNLLLNDISSKSNEAITYKVTNVVKDLQHTISDNTVKLSSNPEQLKDFITSLDNKFSLTLLNTQKVLNESNEKLSANQQSVNDLLKKMDNTSTKGKISETILYNVLRNIFPSQYVKDTSQEPHSGDYMIYRPDKEIILIENKLWTKPVGQEDVKKFISDVDNKNCSGILFSQTSCIANKSDFEINIHKGKVLLYVDNVNYDIDKIQLAFTIVDSLSSTLRSLNINDQSEFVDKETLSKINKEYSSFIQKKSSMIKLLNEFNDNMNSQLESIDLPDLKQILSMRFGSSVSEILCRQCARSFKNKAALAAHLRRGGVCKDAIQQSDAISDNSNEDQPENESILEHESITENESITETVETDNKKEKKTKKQTKINYTIDKKK
jgi:hypothetical protein